MFRFAIFMIFALSSAAQMNLPRNKAIFIIGAPGSGKTETRKALQKQSPDAFIWPGPDLICDQLPMNFNRTIGQKTVQDIDKYPQYDRYFKLELKNGRSRVIEGPDSAKLRQACRVLFRNLLENRCNLVVDMAIIKPEHLNFYIHFVDPQKTDVYIIKLQIDPEIARERQVNRDGYEFVYPDPSKDIVFDLTLRTDQLTPEAAAAAIIEHIENNPPSAVFDAKNKIEFRY